MRRMGDTFGQVPLAISFTNPRSPTGKRRANLKETIRTITANPHREHVPLIIDMFNRTIKSSAEVGTLKPM